MSVIDVNSANFKELVLDSEIPVLVDFWAAWCGPCRAMHPILDEYANQNEGNITIAKLNVDENQDIAAAYQITSIPALKLFKSGSVVADLIGSRPLSALSKELSEHI